MGSRNVWETLAHRIAEGRLAIPNTDSISAPDP